MRFGLGFLGRTGNKKKLPPGQTLLHSLGQATVSFIAPAYTLLTATGAAVTSFIGSTATPTPPPSTGKLDFSRLGNPLIALLEDI